MKYLTSLKLFVGNKQRNNVLVFLIVMIGAMIVSGAVYRLIPNEDAQGFMLGFFPLVCGAFLMLGGVIMIYNIFSSTARINPGFKFFHSISDGGERFREALFAANIFSACIIPVYAVLGWLLFEHIVVPLMVMAELMILGWTNISGFMRSIWAKQSAFMAMGLVYGFFAVFANENGTTLPTVVLVLLGAAAVLFYLISVIITMFRAEKIWERDR